MSGRQFRSKSSQDMDELEEMGIIMPRKSTSSGGNSGGYYGGKLQQRLDAETRENRSESWAFKKNPTQELKFRGVDSSAAPTSIDLHQEDEEDEDGWTDEQGEAYDSGWTSSEDAFIRGMVAREGIHNIVWQQVASQLTGRVGKQCRDRWHKHLDPQLDRNKNHDDIEEGEEDDDDYEYDEYGEGHDDLDEDDGESVKNKKKKGVKQIKYVDKADTSLSPCTWCCLGLFLVLGSFAAGCIVSYLYLRRDNKDSIVYIDNSTNCSVMNHSSIILPSYGIIAVDYCSTSNCDTSWTLQTITSQSDAYFSNQGMNYTTWDQLSYRLWNNDNTMFESSILEYKTKLSPLINDMEQLTLSELSVLEQMSHLRNETITNYLPGWPQQSNITQASQFYSEDLANQDMFQEFLNYFNQTTYYSLTDASQVCGDIGLILQDHFQRAKPNQAALALLQNNTHLLSIAQTPSFPDTHTLQGYCMAAATLEILEAQNKTGNFEDADWSNTTVMESLIRLALDFGDRRLIAGVSFPSDVYSAAEVVNSMLNNDSSAWPLATKAGLQFPTSESSRTALCGNTYPLLCTIPKY